MFAIINNQRIYKTLRECRELQVEARALRAECDRHMEKMKPIAATMKEIEKESIVPLLRFVVNTWHFFHLKLLHATYDPLEAQHVMVSKKAHRVESNHVHARAFLCDGLRVMVNPEENMVRVFVHTEHANYAQELCKDNTLFNPPSSELIDALAEAVEARDESKYLLIQDRSIVAQLAKIRVAEKQSGKRDYEPVNSIVFNQELVKALCSYHKKVVNVPKLEAENDRKQRAAGLVFMRIIEMRQKSQIPLLSFVVNAWRGWMLQRLGDEFDLLSHHALISLKAYNNELSNKRMAGFRLKERLGVFAGKLIGAKIALPSAYVNEIRKQYGDDTFFSEPTDEFIDNLARAVAERDDRKYMLVLDKQIGIDLAKEYEDYLGSDGIREEEK